MSVAHPSPAGATSIGQCDAVLAWLGFFNRHDIDGMLTLMDYAVDFHPLRIDGLHPSYPGHDGVRGWFDEIARRDHPYRIEAAETYEISGDRILSTGQVIVGDRSVMPFSGLYSLDSELIVTLHHYFSPSLLLERLGLLGPQTGREP